MTVPETRDVVCPGCNHVIATVARGVPVNAIPDHCPRCGRPVDRARYAAPRVDPRRSRPGEGRRSNPI